MHSTGSRNRECGLQKVILDLLPHVCAASPRWGESLMEVAPWVSVRIRTPIEPVSDVYPVRHLFLKDSEGRNKKKINNKKLLECSQACPYCASADSHGILSA